MSKMIEMDGYTYTLPFAVDVANNDLVDAKGGYFGMRSVSPEELVTIAAALNDYRPWRYPSRGELPERRCAYEVTLGNDTVERLRWTGSDWIDRNGWVTGYVRAFRELPEHAPVIQTEDGR